MAVLQTILLLILVYFALKLLLKWLAPKLFKYAMKKTQERFGQQFGGYEDYESKDSGEGNTTVYTKPSGRSKPTKKVGEYIDFEEID
ncbi:DUF4834 family protein [Muricauda sp. JGD-17]|uniref:DUF4834 family protein n=1 Tax=Flagellimonas ochracea TaxID=2696472 RepID=A0A964WWS3_9FLAO|nr:DUF4834 family protein [Allomuricauda ochracea]NAY91073.1 DUF4834 family protein [Allomuricauda ochracea]